MGVKDGDSVGDNRPTDAEVSRPDDRSSADVNCLQAIALQINAMHFPYHAAGPNSNSAIATAMRPRGMPVSLPPQAIGKDVPIGPIP